MAHLVLGTDVGGTFTDVVLHDPHRGHVFTWKVPTTPSDPSRGALDGMDEVLDQHGHAWSDVDRVVHGTTVSTNALLEGEGGRVGLVTNRGFEDVLEVRRQTRPSLYDPTDRRPSSLVARRDRVGVPGRLAPDGSEVEPLDPHAVGAAASELEEVDTIVVALLHSYANPHHEEEVTRILHDHLDVPVFPSHEATREFREVERFTTAAAHALLAPVLDTYLHRLEGGLAQREPSVELHVLDSAGALLAPQAARREPARTALSGPSGGLVATRELAKRHDAPHLLTLDMGGTSTDTGLLRNGQPRTTRSSTVAGYDLRVPTLDLTTVGAGGGSKAWVDRGSLLRVGPRSAGADPGPACYGRGGTEPTVTDAHLVLQRLDPDAFLGDRWTLDADAARAALNEHVATPLDLPVEEAASGVLEVAEAHMEGALRVVSTRRGLDPRTMALVAFGGAGPLHAVPLAQRLGVPRVLVPPAPGVFSAHGALHAHLRHDRVRTLLHPLHEVHRSRIEDVAGELEDAALQALEEYGGDPAAAQVHRTAELRYAGQSHEIDVPLPHPPDPERLATAFHEHHEDRYGVRDEDEPVVLVNLHVAATAPAGPPPKPRTEPRDAGVPEPRTTRDAWFPDAGWTPTAVHARDDLHPGHGLEGPAIVEGRDHTLLLPPGTRGTVHPDGTVDVDAGGA